MTSIIRSLDPLHVAIWIGVPLLFWSFTLGFSVWLLLL